MTTIKCRSDNGDFDMSDGNMELVSDLAEVIQTSEQTIKQSNGELKYDKEKGISYFQNAFRDNFNEQLFKAEVRDQLLTVKDVQAVVIIDVSRKGGALEYSATVDTVFGKGTFVDYYNYITSTGTVLPDTAEVREEVAQEFRDALGPDLDTNPSTIQGRLIDLETNARISVIRNNCTLANQINPDLAEKNFLDAVCALSGVSRDGAEASIVDCDLSGVGGTFVPAGTLVADDEGVEWSLSSPVTIDDTGTTSGQFTATTTGAISAAAGTITTIVSGPLGLETVANPNPASVGKIEDNDFELKTARRSQIALNANRDALAIISKVSAVPGVKSLSFRENQTDLPLVIDDKSLISHSTYIVVDGGLDLDVAQAYYEARSGGSGFNGDVEQVVLDEVSQQNITIKFDRPTLRPKQVKITVSVGSGSQPTDDIKSALLSYADTQAFGVGVDISSFNLATHVSSKVASIFITNCEIAEEGGEYVCGTIETKIFEKAVINSGDDIEVIYV